MKPLIAFLATLLTACGFADDNPTELGTVSWLTDHDKAFALSEESGKPVFLLFQEVPGCAGCTKFGKEILSHPLIVESIETDFIPLLVRNNKPGKEAELLKKYKEPSWNYPVVRFFGKGAKELLPRRDSQFTLNQVLPRMEQALANAGSKSKILPLAKPETAATSKLALAQHCFWTGELAIGGINGVTSTEAGWLDGREVTLINYDKKVVSEEEIISQAKAQSCADKAYRESELNGYRTARLHDQKRQLQGTKFGRLSDLTAYQKTKLNAFARGNPKRAIDFLSPRQLEQLAQL